MGDRRLRAAAITGSPGTGKSTVGRRLPAPYEAVEVGDLALQWRLGRRRGSTVALDLGALRDRLLRSARLPGRIYLGHLSHLLPVHDVVVLRCDPRILERRLLRARRGTPEERRANSVSEATDLILIEALAHRRRVWEIDTTRRSPASVAREVRALLERRPPPRYGTVRWLEDPRVTEHLLRPAR